MPSKYMIHPRPAPHRFPPVSRSGVIAWEEGCLRCAVCVKTRCIYQVYTERGLDPRHMTDTLDHQCLNCFSCVQGCPAQLIHKSLNPEFDVLGDGHWTPEIVARLWYQAESGRIPVSGAGYPGPFSGPGFDAMWTDMSEIVRPTRDGIHGREYISTGIDLGRTLPALRFDAGGALAVPAPPLVSLPVPFVLRRPPFGDLGRPALRGLARAARHLGTRLALPVAEAAGLGDDLAAWTMPILDGPAAVRPSGADLVEVDGVAGHDSASGLLTCVRVALSDAAPRQVLALVAAGAVVIHLAADDKGRWPDGSGRYLPDGLRTVHRALVDAGRRDEVTLLAGGGICMAEHVAKAVICGADGVFVDLALLVALECRLCRRCRQGLACPVTVHAAQEGWVADRIVNLAAAWHSQLLEVMGAMGIRDIRRLRGETGRAMFFDDLDRQVFGDLNVVGEGCELE